MGGRGHREDRCLAHQAGSQPGGLSLHSRSQDAHLGSAGRQQGCMVQGSRRERALGEPAHRLEGSGSCFRLSVLFVLASWTTKNTGPSFWPALRMTQVIPHLLPFMEGDAHRIVAVNVLGESIHRGIFEVLGLKGAEDAVPDDQRSGMVAVNV